MRERLARLGRLLNAPVRWLARLLQAGAARVDKWDVVTVAGALIFGRGVQMRFGTSWALMAWGGMLLLLAVANGLNQKPKRQD